MREEFLGNRLVRRSLGVEGRAQIEAEIRDRLHEDDRLAFAYLFGSFISPGPFGDIDVAVLVREGARVDEIRLAHSIETAIGIPCDVVLLNHASVGLQRSAVAGRLLLSHDEERRLAFLEDLGLRSMDMYWFHRMAMGDLLAPHDPRAAA